MIRNDTGLRRPVDNISGLDIKGMTFFTIPGLIPSKPAALLGCKQDKEILATSFSSVGARYIVEGLLPFKYLVAFALLFIEEASVGPTLTKKSLKASAMVFLSVISP